MNGDENANWLVEIRKQERMGGVPQDAPVVCRSRNLAGIRRFAAKAPVIYVSAVVEESSSTRVTFWFDNLGQRYLACCTVTWGCYAAFSEWLHNRRSWGKPVETVICPMGSDSDRMLFAWHYLTREQMEATVRDYYGPKTPNFA